MFKICIFLLAALGITVANAQWSDTGFPVSGKSAAKNIQYRKIGGIDAAVIYRDKDTNNKYIGAGASLPSIAWKNCEKLILEYDFLMEVPHTHFALLAAAENKKKIITVTVGSTGNVTVFAPHTQIKAGKMKFGKWNKIRYVLYPESGKFDFYLNDMDTPVAAKVDFREKYSGSKVRFYTVIDRKNPAGTAFANIRYRREKHRFFPAADLAESPYFIAGVAEKKHAPKEKNWRNCPELVLSDGNVAGGDGIILKLLRTNEKLFCRVEAKKFSKKDRMKLLLQPVPGGRIFQFTGTVSGRQNKNPVESWEYRIYPGKEKLIAEFEIPFNTIGVEPENITDTYCLASFQYSNGEHHSFWPAAGARGKKGIFGKLIFTQRIQNIRQSYNDLAEMLYQLNKKSTELDKKLSVPFDEYNSLPEITRKKLFDRLHKIRKNIKNNHFNTLFEQYHSLLELQKSAEKYFELVKFYNHTFVPGSPAEFRNGAVKLLPGARKIVIGEYCADGSDQTSLLLAGGETSGFTAVYFPYPGKKQTSISLKWGELPDGVKVASYQALPITGAMPGKEPFVSFDALQMGTNFVFDPKLPVAVFYFDLTMPRNGKAKDFSVKVTISAAGKNLIEIPVQVKYAGFDLPQKTTLDTAFCFRMDWAEKYYGRKLSAAFKEQIWQLIDAHKLEPMNLWGDDVDGMIDFCLERTNKKMLFLNIKNQKNVPELLGKYQSRLRPVFFGFDEVIGSGSTEELSNMLKVCAQAEKDFPQVARMCTVPVDERLFGAIDIWCPHFNTFNASAAASRIKKGESVWWYLTGIPENPAPNFNLDSPDTASRIIPWLTVKNNISGLLYWAINREFPENSPDNLDKPTLADFQKRQLSWATEENFSQWQQNEIRWPRRPWISFYRNLNSGKFTSQSGSGNLLYPGPDGILMPSIRLKNLRDGLQDSEYLLLLKKLNRQIADGKLKQMISSALEMKRIFTGDGYSYVSDMSKIISEKEFLAGIVNAAMAAKNEEKK